MLYFLSSGTPKLGGSPSHCSPPSRAEGVPDSAFVEDGEPLSSV